MRQRENVLVELKVGGTWLKIANISVFTWHFENKVLPNSSISATDWAALAQSGSALSMSVQIEGMVSSTVPSGSTQMHSILFSQYFGAQANKNSALEARITTPEKTEVLSGLFIIAKYQTSIDTENHERFSALLSSDGAVSVI